jgi:hypothetical protein
VSPILVRPVREQLEHDRVIRLLQAKFRRRYEVGINPGTEQNTPVGAAPGASYPDVVLMSPERRRRIEGIIEVETSESVNNLEAIGQWARLAQLRAPLHLYVPAGSMDSAKRYCVDNRIGVAEIWTYHLLGDQLRFTLAHRFPAESRSASRQARARGASPPKAARRARSKIAPRPRVKKTAAKPARAQKRK